ncbi:MULTISPECIES: lipopolysaccharide assembly protein LapA domain-containing protein [Kitasatospora]|uniref:Integral membrane protein n=2 Tax=Kitasatospora TaxID=2063 RepID=A0ABT1IQ38_9ACTN|nr:lipopolysaccharide assembly protein LapA domain-containing protein [Kitasatospora paracochleata]MCP2307215.1 putative integral membrane protein [Kitasatospora paracochleata]
MAEKTSQSHGPSSVTVHGRNVRMRTIGFGVLAVIAVWFIAANTESVEVTLWVASVTLPLWLVLTVTLLVGAALGWLIASRRKP